MKPIRAWKAPKQPTPIRKAMVVGVLGATGSGKTNLIITLIRETTKAFPDSRWIIWDGGATGGQYVDAFDNEKTGGRTIVYMDVAAIKRLPDRIEDANFHIISAPTELEYVIGYAVYLGGVWMVVDEVDLEATKRSILPGLQRLANTGRHVKGIRGQGVSLIWAARRAAQVHNDLLASAAMHRLYLLRMVYADDIAAIEEKLAPGMPDLQGLDTGEFLCYTQGEPYQGDNPLILKPE